MAAAPERPLDRRTFTLGVVNGGLYMSTMRLTDPGGFLSLLVLGLTGSREMIGVMTFFSFVGWFWPALLAANLIGHRPYKLGVYKTLVIFRILIVWAAAGLLFTGLPNRSPWLTFWVLSVLAFLSSSGGGFSWVPFMDVVAKAVPSQHRGLFISLRQVMSGALGFGAAALASYLVSEASGLPFPKTYGAVLVMSATFQSFGMLVFFFVHEQRGVVQGHRLPFGRFLRRGFQFVRRDRALRNFVGLRLLNGLALVAMPFNAAFAKEQIGVSEAFVAYCIALASVASIVANLVWGYLSDRMGNRLVLRLYAALAGLPALLALITAYAPQQSVHLPVIGSQDIRAVLVAVVFFVGGLTVPARHLAENNYILDLAPERRRSTYLGISHTLAAPQTAVPILAGWIAGSYSYNALFAIAVACSGLAIAMAAAGIIEPRDRGGDRLVPPPRSEG